jgi:hypothetical protein
MNKISFKKIIMITICISLLSITIISGAYSKNMIRQKILNNIKINKILDTEDKNDNIDIIKKYRELEDINAIPEEININLTETCEPKIFENEVDEAVHNYYVWDSNNPNPNSWYNPDTDEGLRYLTDLGVEYIPEMIGYIKNHDDCNIVRHAISKILKAPGLLFYDASPQGKNEWMNRLSKTCKQAEEIVLNNLETISNISSSTSEIESAKSDIKKIGKLALPYLLKEIEKGNPIAKQFLAHFNDSDFIYTIEIKSIDINTDRTLENFDLNSWETSNLTEIMILQNLHEVFE